MNIDNDLRQLERLRQQGILTQAEYEQECERLRASVSPSATQNTATHTPALATKSKTLQNGYAAQDDARQNGTYAMMLHLILFVPYVGWAISLIMWGLRRGSSPLIDSHGKGLLNLLLSSLIYLIIFGIIVFIVASMSTQSVPSTPHPTKFSDGFVFTVIVSFLLATVYGILWFIFLIISAMNATAGKAPSYPFALRFFDTKLPEEVRTVDQHFGKL